MRKCKYRNCDKDISEMRPNALYCCKGHKDNETKYERRHKQFIEKIYNQEIEKIKLLQYIKNLTEGGTNK